MVSYDAFLWDSHAKDKPIAAALQSVVQTLVNLGMLADLCEFFATTLACRQHPTYGPRLNRRSAIRVF